MDRFKFRVYFEDLSLDEVSEGLKKGFYLQDVAIYSNTSGVGIEESDFEYQLAEQGFTRDEIEYMSWTYGNGEGWIFIDEECTREQSTGLKDKNGVLIYENDFIGCVDSQGVQRFHIVKYDSSQCCYVALLDINKDDDISFACRCDENWLLRKEVIGNIHQNKELLDG